MYRTRLIGAIVFVASTVCVLVTAPPAVAQGKADAVPGPVAGTRITEPYARMVAREAVPFKFTGGIESVTMRQETAVPNATAVTGRAPINQFAYFRSYPKADAKDVVRFNFDMLYSTKASRCRIRSTASPSATATS